MSAIYGKYNFFNGAVTSEELCVMESKLNHWNGDNAGQWHHKAIGMGHLMLYNTPELLHEKLPLYKSESGLCITADARIDNREEIYAALDLCDADMADSTLILLLYEKYGEACVQHLIGDFVFAIWDETEQKLFCARDHMGVKPFFYYHDEHFFAFASEIKGLLYLPGIDKSINKQFLYNQMSQPSVSKLILPCIKTLNGWPPHMHLY
jgi:asparagine synthase (glutamine-hydrolysing)